MTKAASAILLMFLLATVFTTTVGFRPVGASGTIYIRADGTVDPSTAPISTSDYVTYTVTGDIYDPIVVERDNIILEGAGHIIQGSGSFAGVDLSGRNYVTIHESRITGFTVGVYFSSSSNNHLYENHITNNQHAIHLNGNSNNNLIDQNNLTVNDIGVILNVGGPNEYNTVTENNITYNHAVGIWLTMGSSHNTISRNNITANGGNDAATGGGILLTQCSYNNIIGNTIVANRLGGAIRIEGDSYYYPSRVADYNLVAENNLTANDRGIFIGSYYAQYANNNQIYHNTFSGNTVQTLNFPSCINTWDNGYPSGGNYWSDYTGTDSDADGLGDTPYVIDTNNLDHYPLMNPWSPLVTCTFVESGLPSGKSWTVKLNGVEKSTSDTSIIFQESIGSYPFEITSTNTDPNLLLSPIDKGTLNVEGDTTIEIKWLSSELCCSSFIYSVGLPTDASWTATHGCISHSEKATNAITFTFPKGVFHFSVTSPGYTAEPQSFDVISDSSTTRGFATCQGVTFYKDPSAPNLLDWNAQSDSYSGANIGIQGQEGNCYGFASTAVLYYMHYRSAQGAYPYFPLQDPQATSTSDLNMGSDPETKLNNPSLAVYFHQMCDPQNSVPGNGLVCVDESQQFGYLQGNLSNGLPVVLEIWRDSKTMHSVVAYGDVKLENGNYSIAIYDPNYPQSTQAAIFDPLTASFVYQVPNAFAFENFIVVFPGVVSISWGNAQLAKQTYWSNWLNSIYFYVSTNYFLVMADKNVTINSSDLKDTFSTWSDSRSFVQGIPDSCGIEEGDVQVYAVPNSACPFSIDDPGSNASTIQIIHAYNESGQPEVYTWILNASTNYGPLNFTATPSRAGLSIVAGDNPLNATITYYRATQQGYSVSDVFTAQINAGQFVNLTAPCSASFVTSKYFVGKGYMIPVNMTVANLGNNPENVSLSLYANSTLIGSDTVFDLSNGATLSIACLGNTSTLDYGNYTLSVFCDPSVINEAATNFTYANIVRITIPGDVKGDFVVDIYDAIMLANAYNSQPNSPNWNPNADINSDNIVDIYDAIILAGNYGKTA